MNFYDFCRIIYKTIIPPKTIKPLITLEQYTKISPAVRGVRGQLIVDAHNKVLPLYGMATVDIMEEFIPNLLVECMEFTRFSENLNYNYKGLRGTFGQHRITDAQCGAYARIDGKRAANQVAIANTVYGGKFGRQQLGNNRTDDGWNFRGSGMIQVTGRSMNEAFAKYLKVKFGFDYTALELAIKLRTQSEIEFNMYAACWFFSIVKGLIPYAINDEFKAIVKRINGGYNGLGHRTIYYNRCKAVLR